MQYDYLGLRAPLHGDPQLDSVEVTEDPHWIVWDAKLVIKVIWRFPKMGGTPSSHPF